MVLEDWEQQGAVLYPGLGAEGMERCPEPREGGPGAVAFRKGTSTLLPVQARTRRLNSPGLLWVTLLQTTRKPEGMGLLIGPWEQPPGARGKVARAGVAPRAHQNIGQAASWGIFSTWFRSCTHRGLQGLGR